MNSKPWSPQSSREALRNDTLSQAAMGSPRLRGQRRNGVSRSQPSLPTQQTPTVLSHFPGRGSAALPQVMQRTQEPGAEPGSPCCHCPPSPAGFPVPWQDQCPWLRHRIFNPVPSWHRAAGLGFLKAHPGSSLPIPWPLIVLSS